MTPFASTGRNAACIALLVIGLAGCNGHDESGHEHEAGAGQGEEPGHDEHENEVELPVHALATYGVTVGRAARVVLSSSIPVPARVAYDLERMAHVGCPVEGRIAELRIRLGDQVEKGAALLSVESPALGEAQSDYVQKRGAAERATPLVELAENGYRRVKALYDEMKGIALAEVQRKESEYRAALAEAEGAKAAAVAAANKLRLLGMDDAGIALLEETRRIAPTLVIRAPLSGQVVELHATLGELVSPEEEALLVLADLTKVWVLADVPEHRLHELSPGSPAQVLLGGAHDHRCEGRVTFIAPAVDPATRSVQVRIETSDHHPELKPGVFAQVEIAARRAEDRGEAVLAIEEEALQSVDGESVVFVPVAGEEGTFEKRAIRVGKRVGRLVPVLDGLAEGEAYVTSGGFILKAELGKRTAKHEH